MKKKGLAATAVVNGDGSEGDDGFMVDEVCEVKRFEGFVWVCR